MCSAFVEKLDGHAAKDARLALVTKAVFCGGSSERQGEPRSISSSYRVRAALYLRWQHAQERHRRDNHVLASMMKYVVGTYSESVSEFTDLQRDPAKPAGFKRLKGCGSTLGSVTPAMLTRESQRVVQGGLAQCGSVWACPVCSAKIQAVRSLEIKQALEWANGQNLRVQLMTLTARHDHSDRLIDLMSRMSESFADMKRGRSYRRIVKDAGLAGYIRAVEMTHGRHGWHVHYHIVVLSQNGLPDAELRAAWVRALCSHGVVDADDKRAYDDAVQHSFDLRTVGADALSVAAVSDYLGKDDRGVWYDVDGSEIRVDGTGEVAKQKAIEGAAKELGLANTKLGRKGNRTPFQILRDAFVADLDDDAAFSRDMRLVIEYVIATKGRKQQFWSRGLKAAAGIVERTDEEIVDDENEASTILWGLTRRHWDALRKHGYVADYMRDVAQTQSLSAVQVFFDTMFPRAGLPRVLNATDARRIWESERQARQAAAARYRSGESAPTMTAEEKTSVFVDLHPWSREGEARRQVARQRAAANEAQRVRRSTGVEYQHQLTLVLDES